MNRKTFLQTSAAAAVSFIAFPTMLSCKNGKEQARKLFSPLSVKNGNLETVRGNVSRFTNRGGTVGILETSDGFVVIDAQFPDSIQPLIDSLTENSGKAIQYLCNTHHHGDHTAGNRAFKGVAENIIAQEKVPTYQKLRAEEKDNAAEQLYATTLFEKEHKIDLGGEVVNAYHYGAGHTYGDAIYHFINDNVVHMGDLIFNDVLPVYRVKDGSNISQWVEILDTVIHQFDDDTKFIFGHSHDPKLTTGTQEDVKKMRDFLSASNDFVKKEVIQNGKTPEEMVKEFNFIPGHESRRTLWESHWSDFMTNLALSVQPK